MLRDDLGQLIFAPQVTVVEDFETSTEILRRHRHFLQWDGSFITADGRLALLGQLKNGTAADAIAIASASRLQPESDAGPFCFAQTPVFLDEPEHTRFRRLLAETWQTGSAARALESRTALLAEDLLRTAVTGHSVEFIRSVATPLSATVLAWFFGGSPDPWIELALEHQSRTRENEAAGLPSMTAFQQHVWDLLGRRDRAPEDDTLSRMVRRDARGDALRPAEIATLILQTALVSNETVIRLLGSVAVAMAAPPGVRGPLMAMPSASVSLSDPCCGIIRPCAVSSAAPHASARLAEPSSGQVPASSWTSSGPTGTAAPLSALGRQPPRPPAAVVTCRSVPGFTDALARPSPPWRRSCWRGPCALCPP
jgi:cytochrome P450